MRAHAIAPPIQVVARVLFALLGLGATPVPSAVPVPNVAPTQADEAAPRGLALLPFTARGAPPECWDRLRPSLELALTGRGLAPVDPARVDRELRARRLRDLNLLTREEIRALAQALEVRRILIGSLYRCADGGEAMSLSARVVDTERLALETVTFVVVEGREFLGALGAGGAMSSERTTVEAARRLAVSLFPRDDKERAEAEKWDPLKRSVLAPTPALFLSPRVPDRRPASVVVLPFRNRSSHPAAGQIAAELMACAIAAALPVDLYDSGDATRRLLERGWRTGLPVGREDVRSLARDPGVAAVLMGDVDRWEEAPPGSGRIPEVAAAFRLLDTETGEILWAADHERRGDETRSFYEAGNVRLAEALMARAALEALAPLVNLFEPAPIPSHGGLDP